MLSSERRILVLQIEALRAEAQRAERDLQDQHHRHQRELQCLKEESLQVRREHNEQIVVTFSFRWSLVYSTFFVMLWSDAGYARI